MGWKRGFNTDASVPGFYYIAYGGGGPGDGERLHRHTVGQTFTVIMGRARASIDGQSVELGPGQSVYAPPQIEHGLMVLSPGTEYISIFFESDRDTIDWDRIRQEQVPSLTPAEIAERASTLT